ncbi:MAG TPA: Imm26 family immunity protein [Bacteroidia bacterium]|jgi:hypothetical protein|nr:Imm26 family immunity protein [Bacteroidia bacterium]
MRRNKKIQWAFGDIFIVPLINNKYCVGQALDLMMPNVVRCAFFNEIVDDVNKINLSNLTYPDDLISLIAVSREQLDYGAWKIIGNKRITIPEKAFPNQQYKSARWVGAKIYDAALAEDFLNAFFALIPWDDWHNPNYLDSFLVDMSKKPNNLILIKS